MTRTKRILLVGTLAAAATFLIARLFVPGLQTVLPRPISAAQLAYMKVTAVPELMWGQIFRVLIGVERFPFFSGELVRGNVTFAKRGSGDACPIVFNTPVGEIHGRFQDGELLEGVVNEMTDGKVYEHPSVSVGKGDVVMDVGSHLGVFARYAFQRGATRVIAYEPEPRNVACLKETFAKEISDGSYVLVPAAVSGSAGKIKLLQHLNSSMNRTIESGVDPGLKDWETETFKPWTTMAGAEVHTIEVPAVTIDGNLAELGISKIDFVKMDIEGAERYALAGAQSMLQKMRPRMVLCVYHRPDDPQVLEEMVMKAQPAYQIAKTKKQFFYY